MPGVRLPNPSPADGDSDVVLGIFGEDGPHFKVAAQGGDVPAEGRGVDGAGVRLAAAASSLETFGWLTPSLAASSAWVNPFASRSSARFRTASYAFLFPSIRSRRSGSRSIFSRSFL